MRLSHAHQTPRLGSSRTPRRAAAVSTRPAAAADSAPAAAADSSLPAESPWAERLAAPRTRRAENVDGRFYVDSACINCDVCRRVAPASFGVAGRQSAVLAQPTNDAETDAAFRALVSCPTASIHITDKDPASLQAAAAAFPTEIPCLDPPAAGGPPALFLGLTSGKSFGASAYLLLREGGNIMVDTPRYDSRLAKRIRDEYGGVKFIFLTHRDDVGDHAAWAKALGAPRILHETECNEQQGTDAVEHKLTGAGPWPLPGGAPSDDITLILQPGHTQGCVCLHHAPSATLFTGDVLAAATPGHADGALIAFREFCWFSFDTQIESLATLAADDCPYPFRHVVPGHGRPASFASVQDARAALRDLVARESK